MTALAITPLARIARFGALMDVRRMIGVGAFAYAATHILLYVLDQMFDLGKVAGEIVLRLYLTIGFTALTACGAGGDSTDGMVRNLGPRRWQRLHQLIYVIAGLALIHSSSRPSGRVAADLCRRPVRLDDGVSSGDVAQGRRGRAHALGVARARARGLGGGVRGRSDRARHCVQRLAADGARDGIRFRPRYHPGRAGWCWAPPWRVVLGLLRTWWRKPRARAGSPATPAPAKQARELA